MYTFPGFPKSFSISSILFEWFLLVFFANYLFIIQFGQTFKFDFSPEFWR